MNESRLTQKLTEREGTDLSRPNIAIWEVIMHEIVMEISIRTFLFLNKSLVLFSGMAWREC